MRMDYIKKIFQWILITAAILVCVHEVIFVFLKARSSVNVLRKAHFSYDEMRKFYPASGTGAEAKQILPQDASVEFSSKGLGISWVAIKYQLYPVRIKNEGAYLIDWKKAVKDVPAGWRKRGLSRGVNIYAKPGFEFIDPPAMTPSLSFSGTVIFSLLMVSANIIVGAAILSLLKITNAGGGRIWFLGTSYLSGYFVLTAIVWVFLLAGGSLGRAQVLLLWGAITGVCAIFLRKTTLQRIYKKSDPEGHPCSFLKDKYKQIAGLLTVLLVGAIFIITICSQVRDWDGMSHWIIKAKAIFHHRQLIFDYTHYNFYPVLWPLNIAAQFALLGGMYDQAAQWTTGFFFMAFVTQIKGALEIFRIKRPALYLILIFYAASVFHDPLADWRAFYFTQSNAENIFLAYLAGAICAIAAWLKSRQEDNYLILALIMGAGLSLSKLEGGFAIIFLALAFVSLGKRVVFTPRIKLFTGLLVSTILFPLCWVWWINYNGYGSSIVHFQAALSVEKILLLLKLNVIYPFQYSVVLLFCAAFLYFIIKPNRRQWNATEIFLLIVSVLLVLFSSFANLGLPANQILHAFPEAFPRLFLHASPALVLLWSSRMLCRNEGLNQ